ncbi:MAG: tetratricopeptide repeat protein [Bryobacteraceae bacterium]
MSGVKIGLFLCIAGCLFAQSPAELPEHARAAQSAQARGDFRTAIHEYEILSRALPGSAEIHTNLGIAFYLNHDTASALQSFRAALAIQSDLFPARLFSGLAYYRIGQPDAAARELRKAVELNGSDPVARLWLGYSYVAQQRHDLAVEQFRAVSERQPNDVDAWYALGRSYLELGQGETQKLFAIAPDGARAWQLAAEQLKLRGQTERSLALFQGALQRRPDLEDVRQTIRELGGVPVVPTIVPFRPPAPVPRDAEDSRYQAARQYEEFARAAFESIVHLAPGSYRARQVMAESLASERRYDESNAAYREVLRLKPDLAGIHQAIGKNYLRMGRVEEALGEFGAELIVQPFSSSAMTLKGRALVLAGADDEAEKMLRRALTMDRPPPEIGKLLGKIQLRRRNHEQAIRSLSAYLAKEPDDANAHYLLLRAYNLAGNTAGARAEGELVRKLSRDARDRNSAQAYFDSLRKQQRSEDRDQGNNTPKIASEAKRSSIP